VNESYDVILVLPVDRVTGIHIIPNNLYENIPRRVDIQSNHSGTRNHDFADQRVAEVQHVFNYLVFMLGQRSRFSCF